MSKNKSFPKLTFTELYDFLEDRYQKYNQPSFNDSDPIGIPHLFSKKEDIEIAGFIIATIAWGQRKTIIQNGEELMRKMDFQPYDFILNATPKEVKTLINFKHRTFQFDDLQYFILALHHIYQNKGGLEEVFSKHTSSYENIIHFRQVFFEINHPERTQKHVSNPAKNSSSKRINMFLRWMVRDPKAGVDFGIWKKISPSALLMPLDVHTGNVSRKLGLLTRTQNDWQAVEELTANLRKFDVNDPVKYDFALFGLGVFEKF